MTCRPTSRPVVPRSLPPRVCAGLLLIALALLAGACTHAKAYLSETAAPQAGRPARVLLMPPDVELYELTAGGMLEPNAAWTETGRKNVGLGLSAFMAAREAEPIRYRSEDPRAPYDPAHLQLVKLHGAVGASILLHKYNSGQTLPTKKDRFDWTLGEGAQVLGADYGADYALFVYFRDSFASSGRVAVIAVGLLFGVGIPAGRQVGFASLVDLRSGEIVWFNRLASETGDLRDPARARKDVERILSQIPL